MGLLKRCYSDLLDAYPSQFKDEDGLWARIAIEHMMAVYNFSMIKPDDVPGGARLRY